MPSSYEIREALDAKHPRVNDQTASGTLSLEPTAFSVAELTSLTVHVRIGKGGVGRGGGMLVDFPKEWFALQGPLAKPAQTEAPDAPHFVAVRSSRPEADLRIELERLSFDNKGERSHHIVNLMVRGEPLRKGDVVSVTFANTTAPYLAGAGEVRVAVDRYGYGEYALMSEGATYVVEPGPVDLVRLTGPSQATVGAVTTISITAFDRFFNPVGGSGEFVVAGLGVEPVVIPSNVDFKGVSTFGWTPAEEGFVWPSLVATFPPTASTDEVRVLEADGNPIRVRRQPSAERIYWGDLQSHSTISKDALGSSDFEFARDLARLDFFASTEHSDDDRDEAYERNGITAREWEHIRRRVRDFYVPGRFVTLHAYECTLLAGHRCVYSRSEHLVPWTALQVHQSVQRLWSRLDEGEALTIAHHLGRLTNARSPKVLGPGLDGVEYRGERTRWGGPTLDWSEPMNGTFETALEIYSAHGSSEMFAPDDPLAYESVRYLPSWAAPGRHYARDAWAAGHRLGVVSGSDNHSGQPGQPHFGLTAVKTTELTRESVFAAIAQRRTYATTGERIYVEFSLGGASMGGVTTAAGRVTGEVLVAAPRELKYVEVVRLVLGDTGWETLARWDDPGVLLEARFEDALDGSEAVYYLRAELVGETVGRVARAWSSPIWIEPAD